MRDFDGCKPTASKEEEEEEEDEEEEEEDDDEDDDGSSRASVTVALKQSLEDERASITANRERR